MKKALLMILVMLLVTAGTAAADETGFVDYETFIGRYAGNLQFINENADRHLISLYFASGDTEKNYRVFSLSGDVLSATMRTTGSAKTLAMLKVTLNAPKDMVQGDALYRDFVTSGYHCYALLMAMSPAEECADRYTLVEEINAGLYGENVYRTFVGAYSLECRRIGESSVVFTFTSSLWEEEVTEEEAETPVDETEEDSSSDGNEAEEDDEDSQMEEDPSENMAG